MPRTEGVFEGVPFALAEELLREAGEMRFLARSQGMMPGIFPGEELVLHRTRMHDVSAGDVVLFRQKNGWHLERVREILPGVAQPHLLTQEDAGERRTEPVFAEELLGRVAFVVKNGQEKVLKHDRSTGQRTMRMAIRHVRGAGQVCLALYRWKARVENWWHGAGDLTSGRLSGNV